MLLLNKGLIHNLFILTHCTIREDYHRSDGLLTTMNDVQRKLTELESKLLHYSKENSRLNKGSSELKRRFVHLVYCSAYACTYIHTYCMYNCMLSNQEHPRCKKRRGQELNRPY